MSRNKISYIYTKMKFFFFFFVIPTMYCASDSEFVYLVALIK